MPSMLQGHPHRVLLRRLGCIADAHHGWGARDRKGHRRARRNSTGTGREIIAYRLFDRRTHSSSSSAEDSSERNGRLSILAKK